jgi:tellurite resistance protein
MFANLKEKLKKSLNVLTGNKDALEAVCAAAALVASSDGEISDKEIAAVKQAISSNPTLSNAYRVADIERCADAMLSRAKGRMGRHGLFKEIEQIAANHEMAEAVFISAMDVSESDGNVGPEEKKTLAEIAKRLGLNPQNYLNV